MSETPDRPWMDAELSADRRAALLLSAMTLEEKVGLMTGDYGIEGTEGYSNAGIDRLGIPELRMADAGSGVRRQPAQSRTTGLPSPLAIAATWDPSVAGPYGKVIGEEAYLTRNNIILGPNADLSRVPWSGRVGESAGEDPFLAAEMAAGMPAAVQRPGVMACYKHPLVYNQETNRGGGQNSIVDERTIREVYGPPFHAAIQGGAVSLMSSFNRINGVFACESDDMQNKLMRDAFGFAGFFMSDYLANHATAPQNGLDMECPGYPVEPTFYGRHLVWAVQTGSISEAVVDRACTRILWAMFATGLFDAPLPGTDQPIPYAEHAAIVQQIEEGAITLLRNDSGVLPLGESVRSIAVIGADTDLPTQLGGSSYLIYPADAVGILRGITERAPAGVTVRTSPGTDRMTFGDGIFLGAHPIPSSFTTSPNRPEEHGVWTEYFRSDDFSGDTIVDRTEPDATFNLFGVFLTLHDLVRPPVPADARSFRVTTDLTVPVTGEYAFTLSGWGNARLWIDDQDPVEMDSPGIQGLLTTDSFSWEAGSTHRLRLEYRLTAGRPGGLEPGAVQLGWTHPDGVVPAAVQDAADLAADSDVAVVFVRTREGEQQDSASLTLPRDQDGLVRAVAAVNPNTIVVVGTGSPVLMPWANGVAGILHSYFGGQEQGHAIARVLFGDVNPSGRLPYTIARSEAQYETIGIRNPVRTEWQLDVPYTEGLDVGHRGFDRHDLDPQFPFGHGLSYTTFDYEDLTVTPALSDGTEKVHVRFRLTNTGEVAGAEVAQVYLSAPDGHGEPVRKLAGFAKVWLEPGEARDVEIALDPLHPTHPLARWVIGARLWRTISGVYTVQVGASSRNLPLRATFEIRAKDGPGFGASGAVYLYGAAAGQLA